MDIAIILITLVCIILVGVSVSTGRDKKLLTILSFLPVIALGIAGYFVVYPLRDEGACMGVKMAPSRRINKFLDKWTLGRHNKQTDICKNLKQADISSFLDPEKSRSPSGTTPSGTTAGPTPSGTTAGPKTCAQVKKDVSDKLDRFFGTPEKTGELLVGITGIDAILTGIDAEKKIPPRVWDFLTNPNNFEASNFEKDKVDILDYVNDLVTEACTDKNDLTKGYIDPKIERELKVAFLQSACKDIKIPEKK